MFKRENYLARIRPFYNDFGMIKVLVGMRRSGKSVLLFQIKDELIEAGVDLSYITYIDLDQEEYLHIKTPASLHKTIRRNYKENGHNYLFVDEIQKIKNFEPIIEAYRLKGNCSIFITGSNSYLLSGELVTKLTGRYFSFSIYPFSFQEAIEYGKLSGEHSRQKLFDYLEFGGLPKRFDYEEAYVPAYVEAVISEILEKDLARKVRDIDLFKRLFKYICSNPGLTISIDSITAYLRSEKTKTTRKTVTKYLDLMEKAKLFNFAHCYDLKGKKVMKKLEKVYITDFGLRRYFQEDDGFDIGRSLENLVYNELLFRGYDVYVGKTRNTEIDFIAIRNKKKYYFQVTYLMETNDTAEREFKPLLKIRDNYPKYVITLDELGRSKDGISSLNLIDGFLLSDNWEK